MRPLAASIALFAAVIGLLACQDQYSCTGTIMPAVTVTVLDGSSQQRICDAALSATATTGGSYSLGAVGEASVCTYGGLNGRSGAFRLVASKAGYVDAAADVTLAADDPTTCEQPMAKVTLMLFKL